MRPLIVGEAPTRDCDRVDDRLVALTGRSGRRIAKLAGIVSVADRFDAINLLDGPVAPGARWQSDEARAVAEVILSMNAVEGAARATYVWLGRRVAAAFVGSSAAARLRWFARHSDGYDAFLVPHPSGLSRWWNDSDSLLAARRFWRALALADQRRARLILDA